MKKLFVTFAVLALSIAAHAKTYDVKLFQPSLVNGVELKPGSYKMEVEDSKIMIKAGREVVEANITVENTEEKFKSTSVRYKNGDGKYRVSEIRLGGTNMKIVLN